MHDDKIIKNQSSIELIRRVKLKHIISSFKIKSCRLHGCQALKLKDKQTWPVPSFWGNKQFY